MTLHEELSALIWLAPWAKLEAEAEETRQYEHALARGLVREHPLYGRSAKAVAARVHDDLDDLLDDDAVDEDVSDDHEDSGIRADAEEVLFLVDGPDQLCVVNLASAGKRTADSPFFSAFDSAAEFEQACLLPDHLEYSDHDV